jgi:hypothetical protein
MLESNQSDQYFCKRFYGCVFSGLKLHKNFAHQNRRSFETADFLTGNSLISVKEIALLPVVLNTVFHKNESQPG